MTLHLSARSASQIGITGSRGNKYRAVKTNGFASGREARRAAQLSLLEKAGVIADLRYQPEFHCWVHGRLVCRYVSDFYYVDHGRVVIEDAKGFRTRDYALKVKLVRALFGVDVRET